MTNFLVFAPRFIATLLVATLLITGCASPQSRETSPPVAEQTLVAATDAETEAGQGETFDDLNPAAKAGVAILGGVLIIGLCGASAMLLCPL